MNHPNYRGGCKNDEKSQNLTLNYATLDELGRYWNILGSQNIIFMKSGGHNMRDLVVNIPYFEKWYN